MSRQCVGSARERAAVREEQTVPRGRLSTRRALRLRLCGGFGVSRSFLGTTRSLLYRAQEVVLRAGQQAELCARFARNLERTQRGSEHTSDQQRDDVAWQVEQRGARVPTSDML